MEIDFKEALLHAKYLLKNYSQNPQFGKYSRSYLFTSECISRYLKDIHFSTGKALTVLSSGDHVFNLAMHGVTSIDTFDINVLNYFNFWLKYAFIKNLDYHSFKWLKRIIEKDSRLPIFEDCLYLSRGDMPDEVYHYFMSLVSYQYSLERTNGLSGLYLPTDFSFISSSEYLKSRAKYLELREVLKTLKVTFCFCDARILPEFLSDSYNLILLSNISDYLGRLKKPLNIQEFKRYIDGFMPYLNKDGVIINYLYGLNYRNVINNSSITLEDLDKSNVRRLTRFSGEGYYIQRKKK